MSRKAAWSLVAIAVAACAWLFYVLWSTIPFQDCLDREEKKYEAAHQTKENPPKGFLALFINARNDTICVGHVVYEYRDAVTALATVFIAFFTLTLWLSTKRLSKEAKTASGISNKAANAAKESADAARDTVTTMKETAERQLRAYVTVKRIEPLILIKNDSDEIRTWGVRIVWQNTGQTPTKDMHQAVRLKYFDNDIPKDYDFPIGPDVVDERESGVIGPQCEIGSGHMLIEPEDLAKIQKMVGALYLWGIFEYNDVFEDTARHCTEYCVKVNVIWNPFDRERAKIGQIPFVYIGHYDHNSAT